MKLKTSTSLAIGLTFSIIIISVLYVLFKVLTFLSTPGIGGGW